jgi:hypothetical protein
MEYKDATKMLLQRIPAFAEARLSNPSFMSYDDDSPYLVYGDFGLFLLQYLKATFIQTKDEMLLQQASELLSEMLTSADPEVVNLAQVGVLETVADSPEALTAVRKYLSGDAIVMLERWLQGWKSLI